MNDKQEREANQFAMSLLMPAKLVRAWIKKHGPVLLDDDEQLKKFAKAFGVSMTLAGMRLGELAARQK